MLEAWHHFKIQGPFVDNEKEIVWCLFGQRHDGAVFWSNLSLLPGQDFWTKAQIAFERFERVFSHATAPSGAFVPFSEVGVWFKDSEGISYFK